jgi:hypothetical protein
MSRSERSNCTEADLSFGSQLDGQGVLVTCQVDREMSTTLDLALHKHTWWLSEYRLAFILSYKHTIILISLMA